MQLISLSGAVWGVIWTPEKHWLLLQALTIAKHTAYIFLLLNRMCEHQWRSLYMTYIFILYMKEMILTQWIIRKQIFLFLLFSVCFLFFLCFASKFSLSSVSSSLVLLSFPSYFTCLISMFSFRVSSVFSFAFLLLFLLFSSLLFLVFPPYFPLFLFPLAFPPWFPCCSLFFFLLFLFYLLGFADFGLFSILLKLAFCWNILPSKLHPVYGTSSVSFIWRDRW